MSKEWFLYQDNEQNGPFTDKDLKIMALNGEIKPDSLVWSEGMAEWKAVGGVNDLLPNFFATPPPPLPEHLIPKQPPSIPSASVAETKKEKQSHPAITTNDKATTPTQIQAPVNTPGLKKKQRLMKVAILIFVILTLFTVGAIAISQYLEIERTLAWAEGTYSGQVRFNIPQGQGIWEHPDGTVYEGEWLNGIPHGQGRLITTDGATYNGTFEDGLFSGQGNMTWISGASYAGNFKEGLFSGQGTYVWPDGDKYSGQFENSLAHGQGEYHFADGRTYTGEFRNDDFYGEGTLIRLDGSELLVTFLEDYIIQLDYLQEGISFVGEHFNLIPNGNGHALFPNGDEYFGEFYDGKFHGQGTFIYADGEKYEGAFSAGKRNGFGTYYYNDGAQYLGDFKDDLFHGEGTYIWPDGQRTTGRWEDDQYVGR